MGVYKRGRVYWYKFRWNGELIRASAKTRNQRVAEQIESAEKTRLAKVEAGIEAARPAKQPPLFKSAVKDFIAWSKTHHASKPATTRRYEVSSVALLAYFKDLRLDRIAVDDVEKFIEWRRVQKRKAPAPLLKKNKRATTNIPIKPATVNRELACLKALFNYHARQGVKIDNPVEDVDFLPEEHDAYHVVTREEEGKYLAECSQPLHDIAVIMLETGMRPEEVYRMERKHLHLDKSYYFNPHGKTKAARRRVPLTTRAKELLVELLTELDGHLLFPSPDDHKKPILKINNAHYGALKRTGLKFRVYDLRHTFATRFIEATGDLVSLAAILGHSKLEMVLRYAHPTQQHQQEAVKKMEAHHLRLRQLEELAPAAD
ncbi:MAG: tyrosine-type recombinase/integrase [Blastocatellales bacterium]